MAVKVLVMEAIRKTVSSVTGVRVVMSAKPCPWNQARDPSRTTPTASPAVGQRWRASSTTACMRRSSTPRDMPGSLSSVQRTPPSWWLPAEGFAPPIPSTRSVSRARWRVGWQSPRGQPVALGPRGCGRPGRLVQDPCRRFPTFTRLGSLPVVPGCVLSAISDSNETNPRRALSAEGMVWGPRPSPGPRPGSRRGCCREEPGAGRGEPCPP